MIAKLKGLIDGMGDDWAVIDVQGVGYLVFCSRRTLSALPRTGEAASLLIETHVREDHIHLYGFIDADERAWFRLLGTVQGVGAKVALGILSVLSPGQLLQAVAAGDKAALSRAPGVGPKLAARVASELKDKAGGIALGPGTPAAVPVAGAAPVSDGGTVGEAASALSNLGYGRSEALGAAAKALAELGAEAKLEAVIRKALAELAPKGDAHGRR